MISIIKNKKQGIKVTGTMKSLEDIFKVINTTSHLNVYNLSYPPNGSLISTYTAI